MKFIVMMLALSACSVAPDYELSIDEFYDPEYIPSNCEYWIDEEEIKRC